MASYNNMTTLFVDNSTGEEYEFLGTSISYSEKELLALEQEHDKEIESFVQQLIVDGYFDEDWEDEDEDGEEEEEEEASMNGNGVEFETETESETDIESESDDYDGDETVINIENEDEDEQIKRINVFQHILLLNLN
eukprot:CAMPEP_0201574106 /NCGR_PEP_ID=MMETSP0190_2-20130828/18341_1 /ASSEMBLY_ACC=CAM_ASM_000263 /TAXON_ID=37353 /ORGANISM="Rosalina sp." /LENGTH=136 /DNA_ID=CAMNT_0048001853 /DNA_START=111 /DNA_END=522 /DNA_ORIENTATION=+